MINEAYFKDAETANYTKIKEGYFASSVTCNFMPPGHYQVTQIDGKVGLKPIVVAYDDFISLESGYIDEIFSDITKFWDSEDLYKKLKIVHKRGILMYGAPGCGKTHIINKLSEIIIGNGGIVILGQDYPTHIINMIRLVKSVEADKKIMVIFEDIDTLFKINGETQYLQMLDGGLQVGNIVFVATTNYPEVLQDRVTNRPSRFDLSIDIMKPSDESRRKYITTKFKDIGYEGDINTFVKETKDLSIAHIKEIIISVTVLGYDFKKVLQKIKGLKTPPRVKKESSIGFGNNPN